MATTLLLPPTTPPDYHRILSSSLSIPLDPSVAIPVGILACQRDPLLQNLDTSVVSASISRPVSNSSAKEGKKSVLAPTLPNEIILEVILHDTIIFPEGGGQPTDTGFITNKSDETTWEVLQAKRHGGHAVHYVQIKNGDVDAALQAFTAGAPVTVSLGQDGYERRYDHMTMHTSQHLLSALLETRLDLPTLSWSLTSHPSPCYVEIPRGMTQGEIVSIQNEANRLVFEGRKVYVEVQELDQSREQGKMVHILDSGRSVGKSLPEDYTGGIKRVVVIEGVDRNPCCGTHLPSIHNLQLFLLPHTEALSRSSSTSARLYFLSGPRLVAYLTSVHAHLTNTASMLSCGPPLVPERVAQVVDERKRAGKRANDLETELALHIAREIVLPIAVGKGETLFKSQLHRIDDTGNALGFLSIIASAIMNLTGSVERPFVIVLSSSPSVQTISTVSTVLVIGSNEENVKEVGDALKSKSNVKGGGKGLRWSGKFVGNWKQSAEHTIDDLLASL